jgi:hypothetical protein
MASAVSNVQEALKYIYGTNKVLDLFNNESVTFNLLGKVKKPMGGRGQFILPLWVQNPGAFTGITEGGALPTPLTPDTSEATFALQEYTATYDVTWKLLQDARSDKFAFKTAIQMLEDGLRNRVFRNLNSDLLGTGRGELAVLPAADDQVTITVNALPRVEKGMVVDVMDLTDDDTKLADSVTVTAVDPINRTITVSGAPSGTAAGDYVVIQDTCDDSLNDSLHTHGLLGVIDDADPATIVGDYGNVDRGTAGNEFWEAPVFSNSGTNRPFTEDLGLQALDASREKGHGMIDAWMSNLNIIRRYHEIVSAERYFVLNGAPSASAGGVGRPKMGMDGDGKTPYQFSGIDWHAEPYAFANTILGLDTSHLFLGVGENDVPRPVSEIFPDNPFFRPTSNATFEVVWYYQMQLMSDNPASCVKIEDVAEA